MFGVFYFGEQYFSDSPFDLAPPPAPQTTTYQRLVVSCGYRSCSNEDDFSYNLQDGAVTLLETPAICQTRTCTVLPDVDIYNIQMGNIAPDSNVVLSCATKTCPDSGVTDVEIYSLQDALFFNGTPLTVIIQCPPGYICPDGSTPYTVTYPPGSFYFPQPPPGGSCGYALEVQGCESLIERYIKCGSSTAYVLKVVDGMLQEMAEQSGRCCFLGSINKLPLTFNDDVPNWLCAGSEFEAVVSARVFDNFRVPNPSLWPVEDYSFPSDDQPIWMSAGLLPPARNLGPDSTYYGVRLALFGTVPLTTGTFEFSVTAFAPGPREIIKAFAVCPDGTSVETNVLVQDPPAIGTKRYVIEIIGIDTASTLPNAVPEQEYTQYFAATGFGSYPLWGLAYGSLPDWMYFNTYAGVIYGTPPIEDDGFTYIFAIFVQDGERQCVKEFVLDVGFDCPEEVTVITNRTVVYPVIPECPAAPLPPDVVINETNQIVYDEIFDLYDKFPMVIMYAGNCPISPPPSPVEHTGGSLVIGPYTYDARIFAASTIRFDDIVIIKVNAVEVLNTTSAIPYQQCLATLLAGSVATVQVYEAGGAWCFAAGKIAVVKTACAVGVCESCAEVENMVEVSASTVTNNGTVFYSYVDATLAVAMTGNIPNNFDPYPQLSWAGLSNLSGPSMDCNLRVAVSSLSSIEVDGVIALISISHSSGPIIDVEINPSGGGQISSVGVYDFPFSCPSAIGGTLGLNVSASISAGVGATNIGLMAFTVDIGNAL